MQRLTKILSVSPKTAGILFYIALAFVFYSTLTPISGLSNGFLSQFKFEGSDKIVHVFLFLMLSFLYCRYRPKLAAYKTFVLLVLIGLLIEVLQGALPFGRSFDWYDLLADAIGVVLGCKLSIRLN